MTCPDWSALLVARDETRTEPAGWSVAISHLEDCPGCRRRAESLDPTLAFRRLPTVTVDAAEIEAMRERVRLLVASSTIARPPSRHFGRWAAGAAAALLLAVGLAVVPSESPAPAGVAWIEQLPSTATVQLSPELAVQPVFEALDRPFDQVVEWSDNELEVVLVVDDRLDV